MSGGRRPIEIGDREQGLIVQLLRTIGATVYVLGTRRGRGRRCPSCRTFVPGDHGTHQTPGIADLLVFLPARPGVLLMRQLFVESKAGAGRLSPDQRAFRELCLAAAIAHVAGDLDAVIAWCLAEGYLLAKNVPHYRLPKALPS